MHDNHTYNLLSQMTEEQRSLWRIQDAYQQDAGDCKECKVFWGKMAKDKEDHIRELTELVKSHLK